MRVAAIQTTATAVPEDNRAFAATLVESAARSGAELVVLPEHFVVAGSARHLRAHAEALDGPTVAWASDLARHHGIWVLAGSFPELAGGGSRPGTGAQGPDGRLHNTSCLLAPDGDLAAVYRKVHLFDVDVPGAVSHESAVVAPGDALVTVPLTGDACPVGGAPGGPGSTAGVGLGSPRPEEPGVGAPGGAHHPVLGLSICYDLRFPEVYRILALEGATIVVVPAAFTAATGPPHWELLLRARAVENALFVVGAGQVGTLPPGMPPCYGHSMVVDPWGTVLAELVDPTPGVVVADLDESEQQRIRAELPVLANRQPTAYRWPTGG